MRMLKVGNYLINPALVAWVDRTEAAEQVASRTAIHFAIPLATIVGGVSFSREVTPPAASDHFVMYLTGDAADDAWRQLSSI